MRAEIKTIVQLEQIYLTYVLAGLVSSANHSIDDSFTFNLAVHVIESFYYLHLIPLLQYNLI